MKVNPYTRPAMHNLIYATSNNVRCKNEIKTCMCGIENIWTGSPPPHFLFFCWPVSFAGAILLSIFNRGLVNAKEVAGPPVFSGM